MGPIDRLLHRDTAGWAAAEADVWIADHPDAAADAAAAVETLVEADE